MYRTKKDVDKHVESLISKLSVKEFKTRAYSIGRLYFEVGDFASSQRYVEQYLTQKDNNAAAHKLLGQALQKLGQKEKALEQYKTSLDIDPTQTSTILDICELLADDEVAIDSGRAKYWCEKAEATFPRHPVTFRLRERLVTLTNPDPEALVNLLTAELAARPKDAVLHARLLKHYLHTNQIQKAFDHSCQVEFSGNTFINNYAWYESLAEILKHNFNNTCDWLYQLLLLTVKERICVLSLTETPTGLSKSLIESGELLHAYDQALESIAKATAPPGFAEFHASLLKHHQGQFAFHAATYLLKKAKKDQLSWREATKNAAPLMLLAWQSVPLDSKVNWLLHAPEKQKYAVHRWYTEGTYRCSQAGHYLLTNVQDKTHSFLDRIAQLCSGNQWRDKLYEKIFSSRDHLIKIKTSHFTSTAYNNPVLRLPRKIEVEAYDADAQREYPNSLHHFVWILQNYKDYAHFKCTLFDMLKPTATSSGPETLNKLDVYAFLYCAVLSSQQKRKNEVSYIPPEKPSILPANITDLLCPLSQMKWWDCAYKLSQNELGTELTDIRATLSRGIEVVRCIDNHGLDPELLCIVGKIFSERAKITTAVEEKNNLEIRAGLYYFSAIPLLEKLKNKMNIKMPEKRLFDYTHKNLGLKEINSFIEQSKLYVAINHLNDSEYEKAIEILSTLKSPEALYHLSQIYSRIASEEKNFSRDTSIETKSKYSTLLSKAKDYAYKALDKIKDTDMYKNEPLYSDIQNLIEDIETNINKTEPDFSSTVNNAAEEKYSSDENISTAGSENIALRNNYHMLRNISSTPKHTSKSNTTKYRTALDSQILETTRADPQFLDRIETQIKTFQRKLTDEYMEQTKSWFEENRKLANQIMSTIQTDIQNTTDQFKHLKISVDQVKDQIDECRNECKDVGDLKKQIAELKKEVNKLKKASSEQTINESDLYNLDEDYRTNDHASNFATQLPFQNPQMMPPFNQRLVPSFPVPPNPYQLYSQNLYNLYNQYSQFAQTPSVPGAAPLFDPTRASVNYPGVYPNPEMYLDMAHLLPPNIASAATGTAPTIPSVPNLPKVPATPVVSVLPPASSGATSKPAPKVEAKEISRSLPVNVVITSSDPLPTSTTTPAPILSVTIPPKHIKTPHNYQIAMPAVTETNVISPPVFSFPTQGNKGPTGTIANWSQSNIFRTSTSTIKPDSLFFPSNDGNNSIDNSNSVVDGIFTGVTPNTSLNKSRTLSERSNTSVENYDPCPDFKPIIPLPAVVKVTTGEEEETATFSARAKLFRFTDKEWKERGIGEMKLLKHNQTGKVRVLMRREQIHKICANHVISPDMEIKPMKNEAKAYFWVANDYADENLVLEKFCIRFKTAELAQQFYQAFEKARLESKEITVTSTLNTDKIVQQSTPKSVPNKFTLTTGGTGFNVTPQPAKTEFGGFTFSSTPSFKNVTDTTKTDIKSAEPVTSKVNVFSSLTFKSTNSSPFSNIFSTSGTPTNNSTPISATKQETPKKLNTSDVVEEFEPNIEFKPVVALPALIDQKTGEEDETILFEHRAKLLRFDASSKEWKERGLGNIKLLVQKDNIEKLRLLMRREQIMKVCCNHAVTKEMIFQKMPNMDKAVTWCAKDFSEGELVSETFCLRFKTVQACDDFIEALKIAQSKLIDDSKAAQKEQNAAKQNNKVGFGDKFKPKAGSWQCDVCYTNNLETFLNCACCEQPKPVASSATVQPALDDSSAPLLNWGDKFKPKAGSWECKACLIRNESKDDYCNACNSSKDPTMPKKDTKLVADNAPKFSFGIPAQTGNNVQNNISVPAKVSSNAVATTGWGDKFKPKEGTWECKQCFVRNESNVEICSACASPKDPSAVTNESKSVFVNVTSGPKFNFGIPQNTTDEQKQKSEGSSIFDGTGAHKFNFGIPANTQEKPPNVISFGEQKPPTFGISKQSASSEGPLNLASNKNLEQSKQEILLKPALLPTPQPDSSSFGGRESGTFDFVFKPKTPPKGKSPVKSPKGQEGDDSDGNEYASEDEGHHIHFNPVIPMPDKVDVVTGEENEIELYEHRAKLFRFISGEWKERGIGNVKILKHQVTGKLRVVMRREQVHKICLNHALVPEIAYTPKDEKTWLFAANDFSEGQLSLEQFCLRFKSKEIALEFKDAIDKTRDAKLPDQESKESDKDDTGCDDVVFVNEIHATAEEKQKAIELMLPENFFTYKTKDPCQGCRGCNDDDISRKTAPTSVTTTSTKFSTITSAVSTPVKTSVSSLQSPMNSIYGTPANFDRTVDASLFRTPLGSLGSNANSISPVTPNSTFSGSDTTNKENTFVQKSFFAGFGEQSSIFTTPQNKSNIFGSGDKQTNSKSSILAAPKLNNLQASGGDKENPETESVFGATQAKSIFGEEKQSVFGNIGPGSNKSIFGFPANNNKDESPKPEVKSIFGSEHQKPVNLFSGTGAGSLFGPKTVPNQTGQLGIFESSGTFNAPHNQAFGNGKSIFDGTPKQNVGFSFNAVVDNIKLDMTATNDQKPEEKEVEEKPEITSTPFSVDKSLSFAELSTAVPKFTVQAQPDFKWEGAGQQLFGGMRKGGNNDADNSSKLNESGAGDEAGAADEEYDPHYEPIVPLPDKIVVTTGEEDEEKMFGERCKLYRYDDKSREWKERGVGEMKILYHPERKTYRLLLRREQVHKAVLNMLLFMDLELLPMKNSDRAWTWAGRNYAEVVAGEQETLAVRFKSVDLAKAFHDKVVECVKKLQVAAANAIREEKENGGGASSLVVAPLRLPKHLEDSARADNMSMSFNAVTSTVMPSANQDGGYNGELGKAAEGKQVHFEETEETHGGEEGEEDYEHDYEDYDEYYNEDDESAAYYECDGEAVVRHGDAQTACESAHVQVLFDQELYSPKILVTDAGTGEILAATVIFTDTEFHMEGSSCSWSGSDYTRPYPVDTTVTVNFHDSETAMQFYDSCETSKSATYASTDPES